MLLFLACPRTSFAD